MLLTKKLQKKCTVLKTLIFSNLTCLTAGASKSDITIACVSGDSIDTSTSATRHTNAIINI